MELADLVRPLLETYAGQNGLVLQIVTIVGSLRLVFKPLVELAQGVVKATPTKADDVWLAKILGTGTYKKIAFIVDYFASIKLPGRA